MITRFASPIISNLAIMVAILACGGGGGPTDPVQQPSQVGGAWSYRVSNVGGNPCLLEVLMTVSQTGSAFSGSYQGNANCGGAQSVIAGTVINGVVSGETVSFDLDAPGFHHTGSVSGSTMSGQFTLQLPSGGTATGSWTANKGGTIPPPLGTRENPARTNQTIGITATNSIWGDGVLHITLLAPIIRGQEALSLVKEWNQFNDDPPPGFEYLLASFRVRVITTGPEGIDINHARFDAVSADGVLYSTFVFVAGLTPDLDTTIFTGGTHEGYTPFIVRIGDQPSFLFDEGRPWATWFRP